MDKLLRITNGQCVPRERIPCLPFVQFSRLLCDFLHYEGFIVQLFAYEDAGESRLLAVVRNRELYVVETVVKEEFLSLTLSGGPKFSMFEREIAEQYGLRPLGHPWLKMVRYHPNVTGRPDVFDNDYLVDIPGKYPYFQVEGESIHEVGVGPVHAGIIEPGHFRFQCSGEEVLHLEIQLGYQHRGIERLLTTVPQKRWPTLWEGIAGDTTIGHGLCGCQAIEALGGVEVEPGARLIRTMALELERIANHLGDLGALSGDVAFNPPAAYLGRIRGEFLNLLLTCCGNRFGKSLLRPGGVTQVAGDEQWQIIGKKLKELRPQIDQVCDLLFSAHTVQGRFENTGTVSRKTAEKLGLVGYSGRASGLAYDVRTCFPCEFFGSLPAGFNKVTNGDVYSRAMVRWEEITHSLDAIHALMGMEVASPQPIRPQEHPLAPSSFVVTLNEGWRGECSHCLLTDAQGKVIRYKVKDPSFHNWTGLAMALRNQEISDFPLCNKSFNLSYCGFDL